jgi:formate dehydrogenase major subunit
VPGLGASFGRGAATNPPPDLKHTDCVLIMGSNMAECHPVAFRFVVDAKTRMESPATVIHADPRFTRTSALADIYAPVRAGSDIVFLGAVVKYVIDKLEPIFTKDEGDLSDRDRFHRDYLVHYTNAPTLLTDDYKDAEDDQGGLFAGFDAEKKIYDVVKWRYDNGESSDTGKIFPGRVMGIEVGQKPDSPGEDRDKPFSQIVKELIPPPPKQDPTLQNPRCIFQVLKRHYQRYTPEMVEEVCGTPQETFRKVAEALWNHSGPDHTSAVCYAVGWTQHTVGVQIIRTAGIMQLLLGNIGRPGGGIVALRGHASIQGSTDIATLYDIHPGYLKTPNALRRNQHLREYIKDQTAATSYWSNFPAFIVSQLKAWFGDAATKENDYCFDYLPQISGDHSHMAFMAEMAKGNVKGLFAIGQNPAVGGQNASTQRKALAKLDWLVVRDLFETETATFWKDSPEVKSGELKPEQIQTEVFFLPAAGIPETEGCLTNTQRLAQFHDKAADPPDDARSDIWFTVHLATRLKKLYAESKLQRDKPIQDLTWDYMDPEANKDWRIKDEPSQPLILKEINGYPTKDGLKKGKSLSAFADLKDDGSTACGAWVYTGIYAPTAEDPMGHNWSANREASRPRDSWVALGWGFSWPANRRVMYNRCSADPQGEPWVKEKRLAKEFGPKDGKEFRGYVWWDAKAVNKATGKEGMWVGLDVPDFAVAKPPDKAADPKGVGLDYQDGASPFIMQGDGKAWLFAPISLKDGPLPTHYEPVESPIKNPLYKNPLAQSNPTAIHYKAPNNELAEVGSPQFPHMLSTYRLTEHHLSGSMSRWLPWLVELQPELFCEISPEHAAELGVSNTDKVTITTRRGSVTAKALVTRRIRPLQIQGKKVHHVGLPWHWGYKGYTKGDVVNNLTAMVGEPNVMIHESKIFVCNVTRA